MHVPRGERGDRDRVGEPRDVMPAAEEEVEEEEYKLAETAPSTG